MLIYSIFDEKFQFCRIVFGKRRVRTDIIFTKCASILIAVLVRSAKGAAHFYVENENTTIKKKEKSFFLKTLLVSLTTVAKAHWHEAVRFQREKNFDSGG